MKHLYLVPLLTLAFPAFSQNQTHFDDLKTGKFTYAENEGETEIIRTKRKQTEIYNDGKSKLVMKIRWENDTTYVLTLKREVNAPGCLQKGDWIRTTIVKRSGNRYECSSTSKRCGSLAKIVIIKLE